MSDKIVYVVHSIDTEGPLFESVNASFERIKNTFGIEIKPTRENLRKLQNKELDLGGKEEQVAKILAPDLLNYMDDYGKLENMLDHIGSIEFRNKITDSFGNGWIYNWHCVDHIGYQINPRRKDIGIHNIYDFYVRWIEENNHPDKIHWHFHPSHHTGASHFNATNYFRDLKFFKIIARRIIERNWFPSVNRAGFHVERPDSHWLLEQWIPFDLSNQSVSGGDEQDDVSGGRYGDWRRAPDDWIVYKPSHDDYQVEGSCRRYIGRCLNVGTRFRLLDEKEVVKAFETAEKKGKALLGFTNHDFREIGKDVDYVRELLHKTNEKYKNVKFKFCDAREAFNLFLFGEIRHPKQNILTHTLQKGNSDDQMVLHVKALEPTFGPQPFLALKTRDGKFYHENFDFEIPFKEWTYTFDSHTFPFNTIEKLGVGTNDKAGFPHILNITV